MLGNWLKQTTNNCIEEKAKSRNSIDENEFEYVAKNDIDSMKQEIYYLKDKINHIEKLIGKLLDHQKSYQDLYNSLVERDARELNYNIRGYKSKKLPATHFVCQKKGIL